MRSIVAAIVAIGVASLQVHALAFHVHAVPDQSRTDRHTHAPAIHHHDHLDDPDRTLHLESEEEAAGEVITVVVPVTVTWSPMDVSIERADTLRPPVMQIIGEARAVDVRSHSPPTACDSPLRGPPRLTLL